MQSCRGISPLVVHLFNQCHIHVPAQSSVGGRDMAQPCGDEHQSRAPVRVSPPMRRRPPGVFPFRDDPDIRTTAASAHGSTVHSPPAQARRGPLRALCMALVGLWSGPQRPPAAAREAARCREALNSSAPSRRALPVDPPSILARSPSNTVGASADHPATRRADTRRHHCAVRSDSPATFGQSIAGIVDLRSLLRNHEGCSRIYTRRFDVRKSFPGSGLRARLL